MAERFTAGDRVRASRADPAYHSRLPRYARGAVGTVLGVQGWHPLADDRARGLPAGPEPVYTVLFEARELFGDGEHSVALAVWESRLAPDGGGER